jgi:hypothetical protein
MGGLQGIYSPHILETYAYAIRDDDSKCAEAFEGKMVAL